MTTQIFVQHHPLRSAYLPVLLARLPDSTRVVTDTDSAGSWPSYQRCMEAAGESSHLVILQDDVYPCDDFACLVQGAIDVRPDVPFTVYYGGYPMIRKDKRRRHSYHKAMDRGLSWATVPFYGGPGLVWPVDFAKQWLCWVRVAERDPLFWQDSDVRYDKSRFGEDARLVKYLQYLGIPFYATVPSLVEHLGHKAGDSIVGIDLIDHKAFSFSVRVGKVDWSKGA